MFQPRKPIKITRTEGGYKISDGDGRALLYIYCRETAADARAAGVLTFEEGEALAKVVARAIDAAPATDADSNPGG
jgi:hypothetical protein